MAKRKASEAENTALSTEIMLQSHMTLREIFGSPQAIRVHSYGVDYDKDNKPVMRIYVDEKATVSEKRYMDKFAGRTFKVKDGGKVMEVPLEILYSPARQAW